MRIVKISNLLFLLSVALLLQSCASVVDIRSQEFYRKTIIVNQSIKQIADSFWLYKNTPRPYAMEPFMKINDDNTAAQIWWQGTFVDFQQNSDNKNLVTVKIYSVSKSPLPSERILKKAFKVF